MAFWDGLFKQSGATVVNGQSGQGVPQQEAPQQPVSSVQMEAAGNLAAPAPMETTASVAPLTVNQPASVETANLGVVSASAAPTEGVLTSPTLGEQTTAPTTTTSEGLVSFPEEAGGNTPVNTPPSLEVVQPTPVVSSEGSDVATDYKPFPGVTSEGSAVLPDAVIPSETSMTQTTPVESIVPAPLEAAGPSTLETPTVQTAEVNSPNMGVTSLEAMSPQPVAETPVANPQEALNKIFNPGVSEGAVPVTMNVPEINSPATTPTLETPQPGAMSPMATTPVSEKQG